MLFEKKIDERSQQSQSQQEETTKMSDELSGQATCLLVRITKVGHPKPFINLLLNMLLDSIYHLL